MDWLKLSVWIGTYGFLKEYRPEDPYITQYLTTNPMNFTKEEVNQDIYPVATYVTLSQLIVVFLLTDWLRYKPVIIAHALSGVMMQILLIWFRSKFAMYIMEGCYGTMTACEIAYYTYIYAKVDKKHYQIVTSHMRAASLCGRFMSGVTSQILLQLEMLTVADLNYLTLAGISMGLFWSLTLPPVNTSMYFHRSNSVVNYSEKNGARICPNGDVEILERTPVLKKVCSKSIVLSRLWTDFKYAYTNTYVLKWSIWWSIATCGYYQIMTYVQLLWERIRLEDPSMHSNTIYNGAIEAVYTLLISECVAFLQLENLKAVSLNKFEKRDCGDWGAAAAFSFGYLKLDWKIYGEVLLGACTLIEGVLVYWSAHVVVIWSAYLAYVLFGILYNIMMTVTNSEVARHIPQDSYALIFGINTFLAFLLQSLLTFIVSAKGGLQLSDREQFTVYGVYFIVLGLLFLLKAALSTLSNAFRCM